MVRGVTKRLILTSEHLRITLLLLKPCTAFITEARVVVALDNTVVIPA